MKIAICDDKLPMHLELKKCLEKYSEDRNLIFLYTDFMDGTELLSSNDKFDIVFMDYQMPNMDGIEVARHLRQKKQDVTIIFLTSFPHIVFDSFEVNTFRFLLKPIDDEKLTSALDDYFAEQSDDKFVFIKVDDDNKRIKIDDIIYAEADDKYCYIRTIGENFLCKKSISDLEKLLPKDKFLRSHRSYIVNFKHIVSHNSREIVFDNKEKALISKLKLAEFKRKFLNYIKRYNIEKW